MGYSFDSLEPYIDTHTLSLHYNKHQKNYLNKLNELLLKYNYDFKEPILNVLKDINMFNISDRGDILYNFGGVINHDIYFNSMNKNKTRPNSILSKKIDETFGSYDSFKKIFKDKALSLKGSGYTFLVLNNNRLDIINLLNQDNPYSHNLIPLIGLDMWEHAYYINYEFYKSNYIDNFFEVIDFNNANKYFNRI